MIRSAIKSVRPVHSSGGALRRALNEFVESDDLDFFVYVAATDSAAHLRGPDRLKPVLRELDRLLVETRQRRPDRPFDAVILSDHGIDGGEPLVNVRSGVKAALQEAGFSLGSRLRRPGMAVLTPWGLVSSFEIYTYEEQEERAAAAAASVAGVDLCAYATEDGWSVVGAEGSVEIQRQRGAEAPEWSYAVEGEDPLHLSKVLTERQARRGRWIDDLEVFRATVDGPYPDPFHRIANAFELVQNPASVICSLEPGHMYGMRKTALAARIAGGRLRWTHGALRREASLGFIMTDAPEWWPKTPVRADRALDSLAQKER